MTNNILIEATPYNPATSSFTTVRMTLMGADDRGTQLNGYQWMPCINGTPITTRRFASDGVAQSFEGNGGEVGFVCAPQFGNQDWATLQWDGATFAMFVAPIGAPWAEYRQVLSGTTSAIKREGAQCSINLSGSEATLNRNLLTASYAGTGNAEGPSELKGTLKPFAAGDCLNIEPILIDPVRFIYQFHGYGAAQDVTAVYEQALTLGPASTTASTYNSLRDATLQPGEWIKAPAIGCFRLGAEPTGKITADIKGGKDGSTYPASIATIVPLLIKAAGVPAAKIKTTSFNAFGAVPWSYFTKAQVQIGDVARDALQQAGGYLMADGMGNWQVGNYYATSTATALREDGTARPLVRSIVQNEAAPPVYRVRVGYNRCWAVHSADEISPALSEAQDDIIAAKEAADAAKAAADAAQADADQALQQIDNIGADGILDRAEKAIIVREFQQVTAERAGIESRASGAGITTLLTAYTNAYNTLSSYLSGLSPAYTDTTQNTSITRSTWNTRWNGYYTARQALLNEIARLAADMVGNQPAATVASAVTNFNQRNDRNASPVTAPTVAADGTAITSTTNTDGSADIVFKWSWAGTNADIDGFRIIVRSSTSNAAYAIGTTVAEEQAFELPADRRAFSLYGTAANRFYTFFVQAYRVVDADVATGGLIVSSAVKSTRTSDNPFRPSATVVFGGTIGNGALVGGDTLVSIIEDIRGEISTIEGSVSADFGELNQAVDALQSDVSTVQSDVQTAAGQIVTINNDIGAIESDLQGAHQDITDLYTTYGSTASAANSASAADAAKAAAETARNQAQSAKADAEAAFSNSTTAKNAAEAAKTAAETARTQAQTSATNAGNSATAASGHASTASTKATDAGNSATAAAASVVAAQSHSTGNLIGKSIFDDGQLGIWAGATIVTEAGPSGLGRSKVMVNSGVDLNEGPPRAGLWSNRKIRCRGWVKAAASITGIGAGIIGTSTSAANINNYTAITTTAADTWTAFDFVINTRGDYALARPFVRSNSGGARWTDLIWEDVTESTAAATSASSASTSAGNAGQSATAANTSATNAATSAGNASTSATNAATSETNANGSKNAAASSATQAATSATNAGNSASAANTSAGTASTHATNAGQSASAANTHATTASTKAGEASTSASQAAASANNANNSANSASTSATVAARSSFEAETHAGGNWLPRGTFEDNVLSPWSGTGVSIANLSGLAGYTKGLRINSARDATFDYTVAGNFKGRSYRITGWNFNGSNVPCLAGIHARKTDGVDTWYFQQARTANQQSWARFDVTVTIPDDTQAIRPWILNDGTIGTHALESFWTDLRYEDVTQSKQAGESASAAATHASTAETKAGEAGSSASAANTSATNAATSAGNANTSAGQASTHATNASNANTSAQGAMSAAQTAATVAASVSTGLITKNPAFSDWSGTYPSSWQLWAQDEGSGVAKVAGETSPNAVRIVGGANGQAGLQQTVTTTGAKVGDWIVVEADVLLNSGPLTGAGVLVRFAGAADINLTFSNEPTTAGVAPGAGVGGSTYRYRKLVRVASGSQTQNVVFFMSHWSGFGAVTAANNITFMRVGWRPAADQEIAAKQASADIITLNASVSTQSSAIATLQGTTSSLSSTVTAQGSSISSLQTASSTQAGQISTLQTQVSAGGGNLLSNTDLAVDTSGWNFGTNHSGIGIRLTSADQWAPIEDNALQLLQPNNSSSGFSEWDQYVSIRSGEWYEASSLAASHRCNVEVFIQFFDASNNGLSAPSTGQISAGQGSKKLSDWSHLAVKGQAPANAVRARIILRKYGTTSGTDSYAWFCRPQIAVTRASSASPLAYAPGSARATITTQAQTISTLNGSLSTLSSTVSTQGGSISTLQSSMSSAQGSISTLQSNVSTLQGNVSTLQGSMTTATGNISTLQTNVSSQGSSISSIQSTLSSATSNISTLQTTVAASSSPNLIRNGGFELGMTAWAAAGPVPYTPQYWGWGPYTSSNSYTNNTGSTQYLVLQSEPIPIAGGYVHTLAADSNLQVSSGSAASYLELAWYNGTTFISQQASAARSGNHSFDTTGNSRTTLKVAPTSPSNANHARVRLVTSVNNGAVIGGAAWRQVKLEFGNVATPYSGEATAYQIWQSYSTLNSSHSSLSSTVSTQGGSISTLQSSTTTLQGNVSTLQSTVSSQGTSITNLQTTTSTAAGQIATLQTQVSAGGGNLLDNTDFVIGTNGWGTYTNGTGFNFGRNLAGDSWRPTGENVLSIEQTNTTSGVVGQCHQSNINIVANRWYEFSGLVASHRANTELMIEWVNTSGTNVGVSYGGQVAPTNGGPDIWGWSRSFVKAQAPSNAVRATPVFRKLGTSSGSNSYAWMARPQFIETLAGTASPLAYNPGRNGAAVSSLSSSISTTNSQLSTLSTTVSTQGGSISTMQSSLTTLQGSVSSLSNTVSTQGSAISSLQTATSTTAGNVATLTTRLQAGSGYNLIRNSSFENGMTGWNWAGVSFAASIGSNWGSFAQGQFNGGSVNGYVYLDTARMDADATGTFTASFDWDVWTHNNTAYEVWSEILWFNNTGAEIGRAYGPHAYGSGSRGFWFGNGDGSNRRDTITTGTAPNGTVRALVRYIAYSTQLGGFGIRQTKLERGNIATPYSADATIVQSFETLSSLSGQYSSLSNTVSTINSSVTTQQTAINNLQGRTSAYWQVEAVAGGRAQLKVFADANGGAGVDIVGDLRVHGNAMISGTINPEALSLGRFVKRINGNGGGSPNAGETRLLYAQDVGETSANGSYLIELSGSYQTTVGTQSGNHNGLPFYSNHLPDGGLLVRLNKGGSTIWETYIRANELVSSNNVGHKTVSLNRNIVVDSPGGADGGTGTATILIYAIKGNQDTGIVSGGDYYNQNVSADYRNFSVAAKTKWTFI